MLDHRSFNNLAIRFSYNMFVYNAVFLFNQIDTNVHRDIFSSCCCCSLAKLKRTLDINILGLLQRGVKGGQLAVPLVEGGPQFPGVRVRPPQEALCLRNQLVALQLQRR